MKKLLIAAGITLATLTAGYAETPKSDSTLSLATASIETVPQNHFLDGTIEAVNKSTVAAQTGGQIEEILFDIDDYVEKDQIILRLKDTQQRSALEQAQAQFTQAESDRDRITRVFEKGVATEAEKELAETAFKTARASLESAREQLDYTIVRAPYTGIVIKRHVEPGEIASPGTPLMSGISLEELRVNVDVPQSLINRVREYKSAYILSGEGPLIQAKKLTVFPYADAATNSFKVRLDLPEHNQQLFPGMFVKVGFFTGTRDILTVPSASIVYRSEVTGIYVVSESGKISLRHIRVGDETGDRTVILSGLVPGEDIAIDPVAAGVMARQSLLKE